MDSKDFENIYQDSKQIENTKQKDQKRGQKRHTKTNQGEIPAA